VTPAPAPPPFLSQGHAARALNFLSEALRRDPDDSVSAKLLRGIKRGEMLKEQGNVAFKSGKWEDALAAYASALELDPRNKVLNAKLRCNRAATLVKAGRVGEAVSECDAAIELDDANVKAYVRRAQANVALADADSLGAAVRDYAKAKELIEGPAAPAAAPRSARAAAAPATPAISPESRELLREVEVGLKAARVALAKAKKKDYYKLLEVRTRTSRACTGARDGKCRAHPPPLIFSPQFDKDADDDAIKKAYRKAALKWHPDRHSTASDADKKKAEAVFKDMTGARRGVPRAASSAAAHARASPLPQRRTRSSPTLRSERALTRASSTARTLTRRRASRSLGAAVGGAGALVASAAAAMATAAAFLALAAAAAAPAWTFSKCSLRSKWRARAAAWAAWAARRAASSPASGEVLNKIIVLLYHLPKSSPVVRDGRHVQMSYCIICIKPGSPRRAGTCR
jgi:tetratricopeptide (TPR) repeat protein